MNSEKPSDSQQPKSDARTESNKQSGESTPEVSSTTAQPQSKPSPHCYKITCDKKRDWIDKATLGLEGFGLFVLIVYTIATIVYACITYRMWGQMQEQTRIQRDAGINSERAWLGLAGPIKIEAFSNAPPRMLLIASYRIKNFGHGPAFKATSNGWFSDSFDDTESWAKHSCELSMPFTEGTVPVKGGPQPPAMGHLLFRDQEFEDSIGDRHQAFSREYNPKLQKIWFTGCMTYKDQFGSSHWTRFCMTSPAGTVTIDENVPLHSCNLYNDTDEPKHQQ
jgi:hypothetical protein